MLKILYIAIPALLILGTLGLLGWVAKRALVDKKSFSATGQHLARQALYDLQTDQGRQALVEQVKMGEEAVTNAEGEKRDPD